MFHFPGWQFHAAVQSPSQKDYGPAELSICFSSWSPPLLFLPNIDRVAINPVVQTTKASLVLAFPWPHKVIAPSYQPPFQTSILRASRMICSKYNQIEDSLEISFFVFSPWTLNVFSWGWGWGGDAGSRDGLHPCDACSARAMAASTEISESGRPDGNLLLSWNPSRQHLMGNECFVKLWAWCSNRDPKRETVSDSCQHQCTMWESNHVGHN